jgi:hypothetical protein
MDHRETHPPRASRPPRYRRPGPWLDVLRLYHEQGYSAEEIKELLNEGLQLLTRLAHEGRRVQAVPGSPREATLDPPLADPEARALWPLQRDGETPLSWRERVKQYQAPLRERRRLVKELAPVLAGLCRERAKNLLVFWTHWQVRYWIRAERRRGRLPRTKNRNHFEAVKNLAEQARLCRENYVADRGWAHLLPGLADLRRVHADEPPPPARSIWDEDDGEDDAATPPPPSASLDLTPREADVLSLLLSRGPLTAGQLGELLGWTVKTPKPSAFMRRLVESGLVLASTLMPERRPGRPLVVYRLAPGVSTHGRSKQPDGTELREKNASQRGNRSCE